MSVTPFDGVTVTVEAAFGYAPLDTSPVWTDVTQWVRDIRINRGRRSEYVPTSVGMANVKLDNRDRRFDPEYASSPYYGDLKPMVPVRIQVNYNSVTYTLYHGFVNGWPTSYSMPNVDAVSNIKLFDLSRVLQQVDAPVTLQKSVVDKYKTSNSFYWPLTEPTAGIMYDEINNVAIDVHEYSSANPTAYVSDVAAGDTVLMAARVGNNGAELARIATDPFPFTQGKLKVVGFVVDSTCTNEEYNFGAGSDGGNVLALTAANDGIYVNYTGSSMTVEYSNVTDNVHASYFGTPGYPRERGNFVYVVATSTTLTIYLNGSVLTTVAMTAGTQNIVSLVKTFLQIKARGSIGQVYISDTAIPPTDLSDAVFGYSGEDTGTRLNRIQEVTINVPSLFDIQTGNQTVSSYFTAGADVLKLSQQLASIEVGDAFVSKDNKLTFKNRASTEATNIVALFDDNQTDVPYSAINVDGHTLDTIINRVVAKYRYGSVTVEDESSINDYGVSRRTIDASMENSPEAAQQIASNMLAKFAQPKTRITDLEINVRSDAVAAVPAVSSLELGDNVAVSFTPTGVGDALWRAVTVQGIKHVIGRDTWRTQLYLTPSAIETNGALLVLNDDIYGRLDEGNKLG